MGIIILHTTRQTYVRMYTSHHEICNSIKKITNFILESFYLVPRISNAFCRISIRGEKYILMQYTLYSSSSRCWRRFCMSSSLVCHKIFALPIPRRSVSPCSRRDGMVGVNLKKTMFLVPSVGHDVLKKSGKYPCAVCRIGIDKHSIKCS